MCTISNFYIIIFIKKIFIINIKKFKRLCKALNDNSAINNFEKYSKKNYKEMYHFKKTSFIYF